MKISEIEQLVAVFEKSSLSKMEIKEGNTNISLEKPTGEVQLVTSVPQAAAVPETKAEEVAVTPESGHWIISPLVGTYYASNVQGGEPLVKVGDRVEAGDLLCIIEAMKVMNEIRADVAGVVTAISAENEAMVEYGEQLIKIEAQ